MPHNIDSMAYSGDPPWHGLGVTVPARAAAAEMISAAGLDWRVEKWPVPGARLDEHGEPLKFQLVRKARDIFERDVQLGLVGRRYEPLQNRRAFSFFDNFVQQGEAIFETAGALGDGERVWVLAKLPGTIRVLGDDLVDKYLLLSNAHDGTESVTVKFTPIRVVCQNTLLLALRDNGRAARVRHTLSMNTRLARVPEMLGIIHSTFDSAEESFRALATIPMNHERLATYLESVFPRSSGQKQKPRWPDKWINIAEAFEQTSERSPQVRHTLWAAYNAIVLFEDYRKAREATPDRRLGRIWFGSGADCKLQALVQAERLAKEWGHYQVPGPS